MSRGGAPSPTLAPPARSLRSLALCATLAFAPPGWPASTAAAQQPPPAGQAGGVFPATQPDDNEGFVSILDGKSLSGWDGDTNFWRVENGEIVGETTPANPMKQNKLPHLARRHRARFRTEARVPVERHQQRRPGPGYPELPSVGKWVLKGYQADIDFGGLYTGKDHDGAWPRPGPGTCRAVAARPGDPRRRTARGTRWSATSPIRRSCAAC